MDLLDVAQGDDYAARSSVRFEKRLHRDADESASPVFADYLTLEIAYVFTVFKRVVQQPTAFGQEPFNLAGFVRMDAALYYRKQGIFDRTNLLASVNIYNLLDQRYFAGAQDFREIVYPGMPFTVIGSLKFEFY